MGTGLAVAASPAADAASGVQRDGHILVLGDSISAAYGIQRETGWVALLETRVKAANRELTVVNASISGETTGGGLARLPDLLEEYRPVAVIVELGGNDGLRGYPIGRIRSNLDAIVEASQASGAAVYLVRMQIPPNYGARYTRAFAGIYERVAESRSVTLIEGFLESVALKPGFMQSDGIHPTATAQPYLVDAVWPYLVESCQDLACLTAARSGSTTGSE
ncbi:MAG: arylesterase [Pseudomonadota bacterium]